MKLKNHLIAGLILAASAYSFAFAIELGVDAGVDVGVDVGRGVSVGVGADVDADVDTGRPSADVDVDTGIDAGISAGGTPRPSQPPELVDVPGPLDPDVVRQRIEDLDEFQMQKLIVNCRKVLADERLNPGSYGYDVIQICRIVELDFNPL